MNKPKAPHFVTVAVLTTITIIFWVFFNLYNILSKKADLKFDPKILEPISPELNIQTLNTIQERRFFEEKDVTNVEFTQPEQPVETNEPSVTLVPEPTEVPIATSEGELI